MFVAACVVLLGIAMYTIVKADSTPAKRSAVGLLCASLIGLVFCGFRALGMPILGWLLWEYASWLVLLAALAGFLVFSPRHYRIPLIFGMGQWLLLLVAAAVFAGLLTLTRAALPYAWLYFIVLLVPAVVCATSFAVVAKFGQLLLFWSSLLLGSGAALASFLAYFTGLGGVDRIGISYAPYHAVALTLMCLAMLFIVFVALAAKLVVGLVSKQRRLPYGDAVMKICPFCAENIRHEAHVCRYCGREVATTGALFG